METGKTSFIWKLKNGLCKALMVKERYEDALRILNKADSGIKGGIGRLQ